MIDLATGSILLRSSALRLSPSFSRDALARDPIGAAADLRIDDGPRRSYAFELPAGELTPVPVGVHVKFFEQQIDCVELIAHDARFGTSVEDWSKAKEAERKAWHDVWLEDTTGKVDAWYPWGEVVSFYDHKTGYSSIRLRYARDGEPWNPLPDEPVALVLDPAATIDTATGELVLPRDGVRLGPGLSREAFCASRPGERAELAIATGPHRRFQFDVAAGHLMALPVAVVLGFYEDRLEHVELCARSERFGATWQDWAPQKDVEHRVFHDSWLRAAVGGPGGWFPWGRIRSLYDERACSAWIDVRYARDGAPLRRGSAE